MVSSDELLRRLRSRVRLPPATMAAVESALQGGRRTPEEVLQKAGLTLEQIAGLLNDGENTSTNFEPLTSQSSITTLTEEPSVDELISRLVDMTPRFELQGEIARGAMGRILAAWDLHLGRPVAIKVLRKAAARDLDRVRFLEEAQVTGQLQHPNIMPVYELGRLREQVAFVMRRVEGRSLKTIISGLRRGKQDIRRQFGRMRLLSVFHQLCLAVAYAHSRGVVHRDLKPSNVMVGDFGEVVLLDWGLCKVIGQETRSTRSTSERWKTMHGQIIGTPAYMAPEQAGGLIDEVNERTDVYGLGAILYHALTLRPPFVGKSNREIVNRVLQEEVVPPLERAPNRQISAELNAICMRCLARDADDRYQNANELAEAVRDFLDAPDTMRGLPVTEGVEGYVQRGMNALARHQSFLEDAALISDELQTARASLDPHDPPEQKEAAWEAERRLIEVHCALADVFGEAVHALTTACAKDSTHLEARNLLCDLYLSRHETAQLRGNQDRAAYYRRMLQELDDGRFGPLVSGEGSMVVDCEPKNAVVRVARLTETNRQLVAEPSRDVGPPPIRLDPMDAGIYQLTLTAPNHETLSNTVVVEAGKCARLRMRMLKSGSIPKGFAHIPAGTFRSGSRRDWARAPSEQALPDFMICKDVVTIEQYLEFLYDVGRAAQRHVPRSHDGQGPLWQLSLRPHEQVLSHIGWHPNQPVVGISVDDAIAYCAWLSDREQRKFRLPTELEWEKTSRGAEGRIFPWGDGWDSGFAACPEMWPGPWPPPVGYCPVDVSPYGVRDFAGGVREWTSTAALGRSRRFVVRGGSFMTGNAHGIPLWSRELVHRESTSADLGFRLAADCL